MSRDDCSTELHPITDGRWLAVCECGWHHTFSLYAAAGAAARAHTELAA